MFAGSHLASDALVIPFEPSLALPDLGGYYFVCRPEKAALPKVEAFRRWIIEAAGVAEATILGRCIDDLDVGALQPGEFQGNQNAALASRAPTLCVPSRRVDQEQPIAGRLIMGALGDFHRILQRADCVVVHGRGRHGWPERVIWQPMRRRNT